MSGTGMLAPMTLTLTPTGAVAQARAMQLAGIGTAAGILGETPPAVYTEGHCLCPGTTVNGLLNEQVKYIT